MSDDLRPDPDALLAAIHDEESKSKRGKLKLFPGMAAGVGKTYAMLEAAIRKKKDGADVLIGYVETHGRKDTDALAQKLPQLPRKKFQYRDIALRNSIWKLPSFVEPGWRLVPRRARATRPQIKNAVRPRLVHRFG